MSDKFILEVICGQGFTDAEEVVEPTRKRISDPQRANRQFDLWIATLILRFGADNVFEREAYGGTRVRTVLAYDRTINPLSPAVIMTLDFKMGK